MATYPEVLPSDDPEQVELGIVTTADGQLVKFGRWQQAKQNLEDISRRAEILHSSASVIEVKDHDTRERAGLITSQLKAESKNAEAIVTPFETPLKRVLEFLRQKRQKVANRCEEARGILAKKMSQYDRAEEQKAAEERNRQQEAIDRETQKNARKELKAGDISKKEYNERVENTAQVSVAPAIPKVAGNVRRVNYSAHCTDVEKFIHKMTSAYKTDKETFLLFREVIINALMAPVAQNRTALTQSLSAIARAKIKTHPQDDKHPLTVEAFKALYPFVEVREDRTY